MPGTSRVESKRAAKSETMADHGDPSGPVRHHCDHYAGHRYDHLEKPEIRPGGGGRLHRRRRGGRGRPRPPAGGRGPQRGRDRSGPLLGSGKRLRQRRADDEGPRLAGDPPRGRERSLQMGHNNSGRGVGGGTTHFTGVFLRFHESDFRTYSTEGSASTGRSRYRDLEPYYDQIEKEIAVSGPRYFPWGPSAARTATPSATRSAPTRRSSATGAKRSASRAWSRPWRSSRRLSKGALPASTGASATKVACRTPSSARSIHHVPKAIAQPEPRC